MKQAVNFRLSNRAIITLSLLEQKLHASRTAIVEKALQVYAKKELPAQNPLLGYAGILNAQEADEILMNIETSKHNKDIETEL